MGWKMIGAFFAAFWRETSIVALIVFIYLANTFYVDRIKLERDLAEARYQTVSTVLETQSRQILENSEATKRIVKEEMQDLDSRLERQTNQQRRQIEELLKTEIPDSSVEEIVQFLIETVDQLRWAND